jgi:hypothetical protein
MPLEMYAAALWKVDILRAFSAALKLSSANSGRLLTLPLFMRSTTSYSEASSSSWLSDRYKIQSLNPVEQNMIFIHLIGAIAPNNHQCIRVLSV